MRRHWSRKVLKIAVIVSVVVSVVTFIVMTLWNWLIPPLFKGPVISFWQAMGLLILSRLLLGGLKGRPGPPPWAWRRRLMERWDQMTPEEREQFRQGLKSKWSDFGPPESKS